jgi:hypothetical protein
MAHEMGHACSESRREAVDLFRNFLFGFALARVFDLATRSCGAKWGCGAPIRPGCRCAVLIFKMLVFMPIVHQYGRGTERGSDVE